VYAETYGAETFTIGGKDVKVLFASQSGRFLVARTTADVVSDLPYILFDRMSGAALSRELTQGETLAGVDNLGAVYITERLTGSSCEDGTQTTTLRRISLSNQSDTILTRANPLTVFLSQTRVLIVEAGGSYKQFGGRGAFCQFLPGGSSSLYVASLEGVSVVSVSEPLPPGSITFGEISAGETFLFSSSLSAALDGQWYALASDDALRPLSWDSRGILGVVGAFQGSLLVTGSAKPISNLIALVDPLTGERTLLPQVLRRAGTYIESRDSIATGYKAPNRSSSDIFDTVDRRFFLTDDSTRTDLSCLLPKGFKTGWTNTPVLLPNGQILLSGLKAFDTSLQRAIEGTALLTPTDGTESNRCLSGSVRIHGCGASFVRRGYNFEARKRVSRSSPCSATVRLTLADGRAAANIPITTRVADGTLSSPILSSVVTDVKGVARVVFPSGSLCKRYAIDATIGDASGESLEYTFTVRSKGGCQ